MKSPHDKFDMKLPWCLKAHQRTGSLKIFLLPNFLKRLEKNTAKQTQYFWIMGYDMAFLVPWRLYYQWFFQIVSIIYEIIWKLLLFRCYFCLMFTLDSVRFVWFRWESVWFFNHCRLCWLKISVMNLILLTVKWSAITIFNRKHNGLPSVILSSGHSLIANKVLLLLT